MQGVGFRPFVYRIACRNDITGWIQNTNENVRIEATGTDENIRNFISSIRNEAPPAASIEDIEVAKTVYKESPEFTILESHNISEEITEISPDIAVCEELKKQLFEKADKAITQEVCSHHDSLKSCMSAFSSPDLRACYSLTSG